MRLRQTSSSRLIGSSHCLVNVASRRARSKTRSTHQRQRHSTAYSCGACRICSSLEAIRGRGLTPKLAGSRSDFHYRGWQMAHVKLFGYTDKISAKPGDTIQFHVSADGTDVADAQ